MPTSPPASSYLKEPLDGPLNLKKLQLGPDGVRVSIWVMALLRVAIAIGCENYCPGDDT